jgi:hypothetical protein
VLQPGVYRHYKGGLYIVFYVARHHETGEEWVVYAPLQPHGDESLRMNVRPRRGREDDPDGWDTPLEIFGDPSNRRVTRFTLVHPFTP